MKTPKIVGYIVRYGASDKFFFTKKEALKAARKLCKEWQCWVNVYALTINQFGNIEVIEKLGRIYKLMWHNKVIDLTDTKS